MRMIFTREGLLCPQSSIFNPQFSVLDRLSLYMFFGTVIGARLGHCLFYEPDYYLQNPLEILQTWKGGLASHGAAVGIMAALYIFSRVEKLSYLWILNRMAIVVALSCFLIRIGNLMNSEIFGIPTNLPWGFKFVNSWEWERGLISEACHPTQIYEALAYLTIFILLLRNYFVSLNSQFSIFNSQSFGIFLFSLFTVRFLIEFLKTSQVSFEKGMWLNMGQLLSIPFIICGIYLLWLKNQIKEEKYQPS